MLLFSLCSFLPVSSVRADDAFSIGHTDTGLTGLHTVHAPNSAIGTVAAAGLAYGVTESLGTPSGAHQRLQSALGAAYTPSAAPWFTASFSTLGRIDVHPADAHGKNRTGTGDPYLTLRAGRMLPRNMEVGGECSVWVPGLNAPSMEFRATTFELRVLHAVRFPSYRLHWLTNLGYRSDRSAKSAPDLTRLRPGDRTALGLSDFDALVWGTGGAYAFSPTMLFFAEISGNLLIGKGSPTLLASPLRMAAGARHTFPHGLEGELSLRISLSQKPGFAATDPLVPFEPRTLLSVGIRWDGARARQETLDRNRDKQAEDEERARLAALTAGSLRGTVVDADGAPLPEVEVSLTLSDGAREEVSDIHGHYELRGLPPGHATLSISSRGYVTVTHEVELTRGGTEVPLSTLVRAPDTGTLRGLVRSFGSVAISAEITVHTQRGRRVARLTTDAAGGFEISLTPGKYRVMIAALGYKKHTRDVEISTDEVAILNVDMHEEK